jgi:two-component system, chemotaxis family, sensor kinase CheA
MDDELLQEFLAESWEMMSRLDNEIVLLEKDPSSEELIASIFRAIHTVKGTCGFIGLEKIGKVSHSTENVLGKMRDRELEIVPDSISLVLEGIDRVKELMEGLEATSAEPEIDSSDLIERLDALANSGAVVEEVAADDLDAQIEAARLATLARIEEEKAAKEASPVEPEAPVEAEAPVEVSEVAAPVIEEKKEIAPVANKVSQNALKNAGGEKEAGAGHAVADLTIRVNVNVLDTLMNLVGELVLTRNQLIQLSRLDEESRYAAPITHLNRVTTDLQEGVMKTRMQPIGNAWNKLPRLVRDLSQVTGHKIELEMNGADTELDRTVLEAIRDPLTHMVRNSADHGIESPDIRKSIGKKETGLLKLDAFHEGGHVIIQIQDDGAGINTEKVLAKAIANGVVSEQEAGTMRQNEVLNLIFNAGLSTSEQVSSVSGRGVGMDVVKTQIEQIGGTVELQSEMGAGTSVRIKIPLTLAIVSALIVKSGGEIFAIPQLGVMELVRVAAEDRSRIERIHENEVFRLRDKLLPLVYLNDVLDLEDLEKREESDVNIAVVQVGDQQFGLVVNEVFDTEEIVVKPMGCLLKDVEIYQGTTILGDGRVIMILDLAGIAAQFVTDSTSSSIDDSEKSSSGAELTRMLMFNVGNGSMMSVPLSLISRLEEIPQAKIEKSGGQSVVQYQGGLIPLLGADGASWTGEVPDPQPVIVFSEGVQSMGLMVEEIKDIIEEELSIQMQSSRPGVLGSAIIGEKAIEVIDTQHYVIKANPDWFSQTSEVKSSHVLVIDESLFFRHLVATTIESDGYSVKTVATTEEALLSLDKDDQFQTIIADIDSMGEELEEFLAIVKSKTGYENVSLISLSGNVNGNHEARALAAGFDRHLIKFNAKQLVGAIQEVNDRVKTVGASA